MAHINGGLYKCFASNTEDEDVSQQVYCSCYVEHEEKKYYRYLTHNGWSKYPYFFVNMEEAQRVYSEIGNREIPTVSTDEIKALKLREKQNTQKEFMELMDEELFFLN